MNDSQNLWAWGVLIVAGIFEMGWPLGYKLTNYPEYRIWGWFIAFVCITASGVLLWWAQKSIAIGTAYAVWTAVGTVGTFLIGVCYFGDNASVGRFLGVALILLGVITLKLTDY